MTPALLIRTLRSGGSNGGCSRLLRRPRPWCHSHHPFSTTTAARDDEGDVHKERSVLIDLQRVGEGQHGVVANFTMNRPRNQNALTSELIEELEAAFHSITK